MQATVRALRANKTAHSDLTTVEDDRGLPDVFGIVEGGDRVTLILFDRLIGSYERLVLDEERVRLAAVALRHFLWVRRHRVEEEVTRG